MRKLLILMISMFLFAACGGGTKTDEAEQVTPELQKVQKSSDDLKAKSDELNQKADSLLNNI